MKEETKKCNMFGGEDSEALNALMTALWIAAGGKDYVYKFLEDTPKSTLIVLLYDALKEAGYKIVKQ